MQGLLRRFFAPRWQHPDPRVRRQAVDRLDASRADQRRALESLALDTDASVRLAALAHLDDPESLLALHAAAPPSAELHRRLAALLCGRQTSQALSARIALVERLDAPALLEEIALQGDNQQLRLAALARLDDEEALIRQACDNGIAAVRHAAAARVESEAGLARLVQEARRDRQVARQARERLNRLRADAAFLVAARERREALLQDLERHAKAPWEPLYGGRFRHLMREWSALEDLPDAEQEHRYQEACLRCRKVIGDHEALQRMQEAAHQRREDADQARESLVAALEESLDALTRGESVTAQDIASLRSQKQLLAHRWQALSDQHLANESLRERYDAASRGFDRISQAWVRFDERANEMQRALDDGDDERLRALVDATGWPETLAPAPLLARARTRLAAQRDATSSDSELPPARLSELEDRLIQLERLLESGAFKGASRLHQRLRHEVERLPTRQLSSFEARLRRLGARLAELRDWRGFVAGPKRDQLCEAIEALAEENGLADDAIDRRHRQLIKEWKALGDAAANREQSRRFRTASERLHERLAPWRTQLNEQRQRNLEAREALCEQLESLLDQPAQAADPDALRQIRDKAREQWRLLSPVPRERSEEIGRRFGRIRHELQALIDRRAREIAAAKRELIEHARQLAGQRLPAAQRAEQAKSLQQRWRELGRAPKGEEQALWREFRGLCDSIFASREAERESRDQQAREQLDAMQALVDRLDAWHPTGSGDVAVLEAAILEAATLEPLPPGRRTEGMRRRWSGIIRARRERLARLAVVDEIQRWRGLQTLLAAHLQADAEALAGGEPRSVALPDALPLPADMRDAHERRNAARHQPPAPAKLEERLARVRAHLSLLAVGRVSHRDDPLRLAIQVERLSEGLGRGPSRADELHGVLRELLALGPMPPELWAAEVAELDRMLEQLSRLPPP